MVNVGDVDLQSEEWRKDLVGFALERFTLIEDLTIQSTSSWVNHFYQETRTALAAGGTRTVKGLGRGSELPTAKVSWTLNSARIQKYGLKDFILYEDAISDNIDVVGRTLQRIAHGVVNSVEDEIFQIVSGAGAGTGINTFATTSVGGDQWDAASGLHPVKDILHAMSLIADDGYREIYTGAGFIWLNYYDYRSLLVFVYDKGAQGPKFGEQILADGRVQQTFLGLKVRLSESVTTDVCLIGVSKTCATWKELESLKVRIEDKSPQHFEVLAWQFGITELTDPNALCLITDTKT